MQIRQHEATSPSGRRVPDQARREAPPSAARPRPQWRRPPRNPSPQRRPDPGLLPLAHAAAGTTLDDFHDARLMPEISLLPANVRVPRGRWAPPHGHGRWPRRPFLQVVDTRKQVLVLQGRNLQERGRSISS